MDNKLESCPFTKRFEILDLFHADDEKKEVIEWIENKKKIPEKKGIYQVKIKYETNTQEYNNTILAYFTNESLFKSWVDKKLKCYIDDYVTYWGRFE